MLIFQLTELDLSNCKTIFFNTPINFFLGISNFEEVFSNNCSAFLIHLPDTVIDIQSCLCVDCGEEYGDICI